MTPRGAPRRYDTRFFVAHPPEGQEPVHDDVEVIANVWIAPGEALARHAAGDFEMIFPTVRTLEALREFDSAEEVMRAAAGAGPIEATTPRIEDHAGTLRVVLPNDEVYDAVTSRRVS